jgi:hypothetical protein
MKVIALGGYSGCGKNYLTDKLEKSFKKIVGVNIYSVSLASSLKKLNALILNKTESWINLHKDHKFNINIQDGRLFQNEYLPPSTTIRTGLIDSSEYLKQYVPDLWLKILYQDMLIKDPNGLFIISDLRYLIEPAFFQQVLNYQKQDYISVQVNRDHPIINRNCGYQLENNPLNDII